MEFNLKRKNIEYSGPEKIESISEIRIEIAGLQHLIKEAESQIKAHEQVMIIIQESYKEEINYDK